MNGDQMRSFTALLEQQAEERKKLDDKLMRDLEAVMMPGKGKDAPVRCKEWLMWTYDDEMGFVDAQGRIPGGAVSFRVIKPLTYEEVDHLVFLAVVGKDCYAQRVSIMHLLEKAGMFAKDEQ